MTAPKPPAPQRLGRRTVLGGALAAVMAALAARRHGSHGRDKGRDQRRDRAGQSAEPKPPIWIGHI